MEIAGVRVSPPFVRLLAQMLEETGADVTAGKLTDGIRLQVVEVPLTLDDHDAILRALGSNCPTGLARLRRELLEEQRLRRRTGL